MNTPIINIIIGLTLAGIAGLGSYYSSINASDSKIAEVRQTAAVIGARTDNLEKVVIEIKADTKDINKKIDQLLWISGVKPK